MRYYELEHKRILGEGRILQRDDMLILGYSNTRLSFAVTGGSVYADMTVNHRLFADYACLMVYVDGLLTGRICVKDLDGHTKLCELPQDSGVHIVTLHKISEAMSNWIGIRSVMPKQGELLDLETSYAAQDVMHRLQEDGFFARPEAGKVLVLGDSMTCGYALYEGEHARAEYEDASASYAYQALCSLGYMSEYVCASGFGMYQDYCGDTGRTIPKAYPYVNYFADKQTKYSALDFIPDLVIIFLGTNDSYHLETADKISRFKDCYIDFVRLMHATYPDAEFLLLTGSMTLDADPLIYDIADVLTTQDKLQLDVLAFPLQDIEQDGVLIYNHPSRRTHQKMASILYERLVHRKRAVHS